MRRFRASRVLNALAALVWCGVVAARPVAAPCPMGGHGTAHSAPAVSNSHATHAAHGVPTGTSHHTPAPSDSSTPLHSCDCLAHCCASALAPTPSLSAILAFPAIDSEAPSPVAQTHYIAAWTDFVLPFAAAPPVSVRT
ncbi:MAG: hypothetical protein ABMA00_14510 [Gemmatimonas sp.]